MTRNIIQASLDGVTLVLASGSERRRFLLEQAGVSVHIDPAQVDEKEIKASALQEGRTVEEVTVLLAEIKARRVSWRHPNTLVLGTDQLLECDGNWLSKAATLEEARDHLKCLRGRKHRLVSSVVAVMDDVRIWHSTAMAILTMRQFSDRFLENYLHQCGSEVLTTVGCYKVEGRGVQLFSCIEGDLFTVMGLPLLSVLDFLRMRKVLDA